MGRKADCIEWSGRRLQTAELRNPGVQQTYRLLESVCAAHQIHLMFRKFAQPMPRMPHPRPHHQKRVCPKFTQSTLNPPDINWLLIQISVTRLICSVDEDLKIDYLVRNEARNAIRLFGRQRQQNAERSPVCNLQALDHRANRSQF